MTSSICQKIRHPGIQRAHGSSLAAAAIGQFGVGSYDVWVCFPPRAPNNSALIVLFTAIKLTCYYECYLFIGQ